MPAGDVALVTGAGSGIGRAVSIAFIAAGYRVVLAGRRQSALDETVRSANCESATTLTVPVDVCDPGSVGALFETCRERFGRLDLLFNNAGVSHPPAPLEELELAQWRKVIDTNLTGAFLCVQHAFRLMQTQQPRGGRIINNGSISATTPRPRSIAYTVSKHGITGLTKATSLEGRKWDIACGQIDIGNARTELASSFANGIEQADGSVRLEPLMDVADVASAVLYMGGLPLQANVQFMTVMATKMPFIGRG